MKRFKVLSKLFYPAVLLLLGMAGCVPEKLDAPAGVSGEVVAMEMIIPGFDVPVTRSIEGSKGEAAVPTIDVLIFDQSTPAAKLLQSIKVSNFTQEPSGSDYKIKYNLALPKDENAALIVIVTNASDEVDKALTDYPVNSEKQDVLGALKFTTRPDADGSYKWNVSTPGYTPIPMYGEVPVDGIAPGKTVSISLTRMLARIDVENEVKGSIFRLEEIHVVNYNTSGYIAPAWNASNGNVIADYYTNNNNPMMPNPAGKQSGTLDDAMMYEYKQVGDVAGPLLAGEIYAYEAARNSEADQVNGTCLIIKGKYFGKDYYYRVDFTRESAASTAADYMPLYRNYKYIVTITAAEGIGYESFDQALRSKSVLSNLKTSILVVDMSGIKHIVYDGQFFMGVETRLIDMPYGVSRQLKHRVSSDYHGDWNAVVLEPNAHTWLRLADNKPSTNGADINQTGVEINVTAITPPGNPEDYVSGKIVFTAGRLIDTLTVRRVPVAELFARSNVVLSSGVLTFAITEQDNRTIPAWSQGLFFKWGSLVALAPGGNPYDPTVQVVYAPSGLNPSDWKGGLGGWDKIPYGHPNFGFTSSSAADDSFKEFFNNTGFDEATGIGDICRYISSGKDGKGWVEGKWRMPTSAELEALYNETGVKTANRGSFKDVTLNLNANSGSYLNGSFDPESGWFLGANVSVSTSTPANAGTPPAGTVFLPAAGHRYPNGDGNVVQVGAYGYYWSATPYTINSRYTVNYLFMEKDGMLFYDADLSYAFPIRCIRDY